MADDTPTVAQAKQELIRAIHESPPEYVEPVLDALIAAVRAEHAHALAESVKLQAHYAALLNMHDGGQRMVFPTVEAWLERLKSRKGQPPSLEPWSPTAGRFRKGISDG